MRWKAIVACVAALMGTSAVAEDLPEFAGVYARLSDGELQELTPVAGDAFKRAVLVPHPREQYSTRCVAINLMPPNIRLTALPWAWQRDETKALPLSEITEFVVNARTGANQVSLQPIVDLASYATAEGERRNIETNDRIRCVDWQYGFAMEHIPPGADDWSAYASRGTGVSVSISGVINGNRIYIPTSGIEDGLVVSDCAVSAQDLRQRSIDQFNTALVPSDTLQAGFGAPDNFNYQLGQCGNSQFKDVPVIGYVLSVNRQSYVLLPNWK
ncbi:hypothetical protein QTO30_01435 [Yoonia sp. GPGPB17]|uniref:hypothetical protein n=1 Tax=Yoonia sp. GPGPB17 TaxID=3026147 RepID=UPI0030C20E0D